MKPKKLHFKKGSTFHLNQKDNKKSLDLYNWLYKELVFLQVPFTNTACCTGNIFLKADVYKKKPFEEKGFSMRRWLIKRLNYYNITIVNTNPCCHRTQDVKIYPGFITYSEDNGKSMDEWLKQSFIKLGRTFVDPCCD